MSRQFNGSTQALFSAIDISASTSASIAFWLWWDAFANNDKLAFEYTANFNSNNGFIIDPNSTAPANGNVQIGFHTVTPAVTWVDQFTRPSAAVWHHWTVTYDIANKANTAYIDGVAQSLSTATHSGTTSTASWSNSTLNFMSRNHASLWGAGRMAEVALWAGTILTAREALALSSGESPMRIGPVPRFYWPLFGGSPEPDYGGTQKGATLTATPTIVAHPPVRSFLVAA